MVDEYSPGSREIVAAIVELWQKEPATEELGAAKLVVRLKEMKAAQRWVVSEKRMKAALKEFNLQPNQPKFTFVKETVSELVPGVAPPPGVQIQMSKGKGKALFATRSFREGDKLWEEEPAVQAGPVAMLRLMRGGKACAYCAKLLRTTPDGAPLPRAGVACIKCTANWCSNHCKRLDLGHADTHHERPARSNARPGVVLAKWKSYEQFCLDQNWNAGYLYAMVLLHKLKQPRAASDVEASPFAQVMRGMARIGQDRRQLAVSQPDTLEFEHHEQMWQRGHRLLADAVRPLHALDYREYLEGIGMVNINNIRGCIFEIHANLNHSCEPNLTVKFRSESKADGIAVYARKDIPAGQELVTSYVDVAWGLDQRQYELRINWGFVCACPRCKRERQARLAPVVPAKPALKPTPPQSPTTPSAGGPAETRARSKSVHFDQNPVSLEVPA